MTEAGARVQQLSGSTEANCVKISPGALHIILERFSLCTVQWLLINGSCQGNILIFHFLGLEEEIIVAGAYSRSSGSVLAAGCLAPAGQANCWLLRLQIFTSGLDCSGVLWEAKANQLTKVTYGPSVTNRLNLQPRQQQRYRDSYYLNSIHPWHSQQQHRTLLTDKPVRPVGQYTHTHTRSWWCDGGAYVIHLRWHRGSLWGSSLAPPRGSLSLSSPATGLIGNNWPALA